MTHRVKVNVSPNISVNNFVKRRICDWNCYWYLLTWMRVISLYPLPSDASRVVRRINPIIRYGLWIINVTANLAQLVLFYGTDNSDLPTTEYWNNVIDYWNWTIHSVGVYSWIILFSLRENKWTKLTELLIKNDLRMQPHQSVQCSKMRNLNLFGILYILVAVWNYNFQSINELDNILYVSHRKGVYL